jgi:hypothetical protein
MACSQTAEPKKSDALEEEQSVAGWRAVDRVAMRTRDIKGLDPRIKTSIFIIWELRIPRRFSEASRETLRNTP